jgi:transposase
MARPTKYTEELATQLCTEIATTTDSLRTICKRLDLSVASVLNWLKDDKHASFLAQYARAKEEQAELLVEQILEIADDSSNDDTVSERGNIIANSEWISRSKLRVDARKWLASKLLPKKYGDKMDITTSGEKVQAPIIQILPPSET